MLNQWTLRILPSSADLDTFPLSTEQIIPWIDHPIKKQTEILKLNKWTAKQLQVVKVFFLNEIILMNTKKHLTQID